MSSLIRLFTENHICWWAICGHNHIAHSLLTTLVLSATSDWLEGFNNDLS
jgi:hypothetical protein